MQCSNYLKVTIRRKYRMNGTRFVSLRFLVVKQFFLGLFSGFAHYWPAERRPPQALCSGGCACPAALRTKLQAIALSNL